MHTYLERGYGGGGLIKSKAVIHKKKVTLQVRLNDWITGRSELRKTQRVIGLLCAVLKMTSCSTKHFRCQ